MPDTVRVGVIGAGKIAQDRHIPLLQKVPRVEVTHVWSNTAETARRAAQQFDIPNVVDRWERIVEAPEIDAVVIATPPNLHLPVTLAALDSGKHVLCQARMARNLSEARRMLEASKATESPRCTPQVSVSRETGSCGGCCSRVTWGRSWK